MIKAKIDINVTREFQRKASVIREFMNEREAFSHFIGFFTNMRYWEIMMQQLF